MARVCPGCSSTVVSALRVLRPGTALPPATSVTETALSISLTSGDRQPNHVVIDDRRQKTEQHPKLLET